MSRISAAFERARSEGRAALVTYVMAGDPDLPSSEAMARACLEGGADLLELGMPFSDPIADGPTLQLAGQRSLAAGTNVERCLALAASLRRRTEVPLILMGYLNPVLRYGEERFFADCERSGVDGVILPDLPADEAEPTCALAKTHGVSVIFLLAPTSTPARIEAACARANGFLYFVSVTGVTGARTELPADLGERLAALRARAPVPVAVGFGISTPEQARTMSPLADGVVVGSAIVTRVAQGGSKADRQRRVKAFVRSLRRGLGGGAVATKRRAGTVRPQRRPRR